MISALNYDAVEIAFERFSIMTIDGHLTDKEAFDVLKKQLKPEVFIKLQAKVWGCNNNMSTKTDSNKPIKKMYADSEIVELETTVLQKMGVNANVRLAKKIVNCDKGYKVVDYLIDLGKDYFPNKAVNQYWSNYIIKDGGIVHHSYQFDAIEKDALKLDYELSLYMQNNKYVVI